MAILQIPARPNLNSISFARSRKMIEKMKFFAAAFKVALTTTILSTGLYATQPTFTLAFSPTTIAPGATSVMTYTINNTDPSIPVSDIAFTNTLPAGMTIADASNIKNSCNASFVAPAGGNSVSFSNGLLGTSKSCTISVNVTSSTGGSHTNTTGALTSSEGSSGTASATLTVDTARPGFSAVFSPSTVTPGQVSTLLYTVDNTLNGSNALFLTISDTFPSGVVAAPLPNAFSTCNQTFTPTFTVTPGGSTFSMQAGGVAAGAICTIQVDVVANVGIYEHLSSQLSQNGSNPSGPASARLDVVYPQFFTLFTDDPAAPGDTVNLEFTLTNIDRSYPATNIGFTDDLDAALSGLVATGLPLNDVCGPGSQISGTSNLTLTGGSLASGESCTFSVPVTIPSSAASGSYTNNTSSVTASINGSPAVWPAASDTLVVAKLPVLTQSFLSDPVKPGDDVTLRFTLTNSDASNSMTAIGFTELINADIGMVVTTLPAANSCGSGSSFSQQNSSGDISIQILNANLAANANCTFDYILHVPDDASSNIYTFTSSLVSATLSGQTVFGKPATDTLEVISGPKATMDIVEPAANPGDTVTMNFTLQHSANASGDATGISFTDDLNAALSGLVSTSGTQNDICGSGSQLSGTSTLTFSGGTLAPGASCTFSVTLEVPSAAAASIITNISSQISSTVSGQSVTSPAVSDTLLISGLKLTKTFVPDTIYVGDTSAALHFNITNAATSPAATSISFSDSLTSTLTSMSTTAPLPTTPCNGSSTLSGTTTLSLSNGELAPGDSCAFDVNLTIPSTAPVGDYLNATSALSATVNATNTTSEKASAVLHIVEPLSMFKEFNQSVAMPGDTVSMIITLSNAHPTNAISSVSFSDDLDAALSGLTLDSVTNNSCGTLNGIGSGLMSLTNGTVPADGNCTIEVVLAIPASVSLDNVIDNTTSNATGLNNTTTVTAFAASATLYINNIELSKSFSAPVVPGGDVILSFHIKNLESGDVNGLAFTDDLNAILSGLQSTGLPLNDICGTGSSLSGTSTLLFTGGSLAAGASCDFNVTLSVPISATSGSYTNTTSDLTSYGSVVSKSATADLEVALIPGFSKVFAPNLIASNGISTLTFDINNSANAFTTSSLAFTDNLPSGMLVATTPNITNTCSGTVTAVAQSSQISLTGGSVSAHGSCSISVNVTAAASGTYNNSSGALQTQYGSGQSASASLSVAAAPLFSKAFAPATMIPDAITTLSFTIDNSGASLNATSLDFTDVFPSGLQIASIPNASTTCVGGTLTAVANATTLSYTGGSLSALATCTVQVDVTSGSEGDYNNTSGALTSSLGNSGTASANLSVIAHQEIDILGNATSIVSGDASPSASDATDFGDVDINSGGSTHTFTIANLGAVDLLLNGSPLVAISGNTAFTVVTQPASSTIAAQSQTTFQIAFNPSTVGTFTAQISIASNDADENPYTFALSGVGYGDNDGVDEPAGVDGNHDGIEDRNQVNITTLTSGSAQITLESPSSSNPLNNVSIPQSSEIRVELNNGRQILLPYGTVSFTLTGLTPGGTTSVSIYYPLDPELVGYAKEVGGIWYDMNATVEHNSTGNYSVVTFALTDGDMFDLDGSGSNGEIQDPGGAYRDATIAVPVAPWALTLLALLYGFAVRRRFV